MDSIQTGSNLITMGLMSQRLQRPPGHIELTLEELGLGPILTLNNLKYYSIEQETRVHNRLVDLDVEAAERKRRR